MPDDHKIRLYYCPVLLWRKSVAAIESLVLAQLDEEAIKGYVQFRAKSSLDFWVVSLRNSSLAITLDPLFVLSSPDNNVSQNSLENRLQKVLTYS